MKVVYSIGAKFGGAGVGNTAFHAVAGIYRDGLLTRLFVSSNAQHLIPDSLIRQWGIIGRGMKFSAAKDPSGLMDFLFNWLFDAWVAARMPRGDIFHGWNGLCLFSLRAAKGCGMITVVERASAHPLTYLQLLRNEYARWRSRWQPPMWNYARSIRDIEEADYITVPSAFSRDSMIANGIPAHKLIEIPFGVDLNRFAPNHNASPHPFRVIFVGNVSIAKGAPYLLEAWKKIAWQDAELWLVGRVTPEFPYARWANLPGVQFIPHTLAVADLYRQSNLFVFPSIQEGSALVTYEAMASSLPVITTPNAGSVVRDGQEGFIVPIRDVDALCDRMQTLRADEKLRRRMGQAARARAEQFSWARYGERLVEAYGRIALS